MRSFELEQNTSLHPVTLEAIARLAIYRLAIRMGPQRIELPGANCQEVRVSAAGRP